MKGKSGSTFSKTRDDRFIMKSIFKNEFRMFLDRAKDYLNYMAKVFFFVYACVYVWP